MFSDSSTRSLKQPAHQAVIIPFNRFSKTQIQFHACIFCGKTMTVQEFKGKTVCLHCLQQIPTIFSYG